MLPDTDKEFDKIYPEEIRKHSYIHWTPIEVAQQAIQWLDLDAGDTVIDIGAGAGKFCLIGAQLSQARFIGVELRESLCKVFNSTANDLGLTNVSVKNTDVKSFDLQRYNRFYFYNPFCEYIATEQKIDDTIQFSQDAFEGYQDYVIEQLSNTAVGTKIVTYCADAFLLPESFKLSEMYFEGKLLLWEKTK